MLFHTVKSQGHDRYLAGTKKSADHGLAGVWRVVLVCHVLFGAFVMSRSSLCVHVALCRGHMSTVCLPGPPPWPKRLPCASVAWNTEEAVSVMFHATLAHGRCSDHGGALFSGSASDVAQQGHRRCWLHLHEAIVDRRRKLLCITTIIQPPLLITLSQGLAPSWTIWSIEQETSKRLTNTGYYKGMNGHKKVIRKYIILVRCRSISLCAPAGCWSIHLCSPKQQKLTNTRVVQNGEMKLILNGNIKWLTVCEKFSKICSKIRT
jgi:hypothetical protein